MSGWSRWDVFVVVAIATIGAAVLLLAGLALGLIV